MGVFVYVCVCIFYADELYIFTFKMQADSVRLLFSLI